MNLFLIYFLLTTFWITQVLHFNLSQMRGISLLNVSIFILLITWAIKNLKKKRFFEPNNLNMYLIIMIFVVLNSIFIKLLIGEIPNLHLWKEILDVKNWANPIFIFFLLFNLLVTEKECEVAISSLILLVLVTAIPMLIEVFGFMQFNIIRDVQAGRSAGLAEANQYASLLVLVLPLLFSNVLFKKDLYTKIFWALCFFITLLSLVVTGSRGGSLSFIVSIFVYLFFIQPIIKIRLKTIIHIVGLIVVMIAISYSIVPLKVKETAFKRFNPDNYKNIEEFSNSRLPNLRNGLVLFLERPIFGHGYDTFFSLVKVHQFKAQFNSHNDYLSYLIHYGVFGLTIFIMIFIKIFQQLRYTIRVTKNEWKKMIFISYLAGFIGYAFSMLFVNLFIPRMIFWFYTAVIYKYSQIEISKNTYQEFQPILEGSQT